jgi:hypothetical protein
VRANRETCQTTTQELGATAAQLGEHLVVLLRAAELAVTSAVLLVLERGDEGLTRAQVASPPLARRC